MKQELTTKVQFGFWLYLMNDMVLFATLFATFIVLRPNTYGGPSGDELFSLSFVLLETLILLTSSFTAGLAMQFARGAKKKAALTLFIITAALGVTFLALELNEFHNLVAEGHSWRENAFLSSFFTLVGTHGLHITFGLIWMFYLIVRTVRQGLADKITSRLYLLSLFWHFLDVVWIFIFTVVYLMAGVNL